MATKTDPKNKKKTNGTKKKTTSGTKKKTTTPKKKSYMKKMHSMGLDTTSTVTRRGKTRLKQVGSSTQQIKGRPRKTVRGHYKNTKGGVTRYNTMSDAFRKINKGTSSKKKKKK